MTTIVNSLAGQTVAVVGGAGAMGSAIARHAAAAGARVVVVGRDAVALSQAAAAIGGATALVADAADAEGLAALIAAGPFDHLVIATSAGTRASSIPATSPEIARAGFGRFWLAYGLLHVAGTLLRRGGSVTIISGSSGRRPAAGFGFWSTLHGSIEALARAAAIELAPIRVNVVSPGGIGLRPDRQLSEHTGTPDDIGAASVALLANPAITNAMLDVDGGERLGRWSGSPAADAA